MSKLDSSQMSPSKTKDQGEKDRWRAGGWSGGECGKRKVPGVQKATG